VYSVSMDPSALKYHLIGVDRGGARESLIRAGKTGDYVNA